MRSTRGRRAEEWRGLRRVGEGRGPAVSKCSFSSCCPVVSGGWASFSEPSHLLDENRHTDGGTVQPYDRHEFEHAHDLVYSGTGFHRTACARQKTIFVDFGDKRVEPDDEQRVFLCRQHSSLGRIPVQPIRSRHELRVQRHGIVPRSKTLPSDGLEQERERSAHPGLQSCRRRPAPPCAAKRKVGVGTLAVRS